MLANHVLTTAVLLAATVIAPNSSETRVLWVDDDACPGMGSGNPSDPFCRIQPAYDYAADGDEIRVRPGTYRECVRANDPATGKAVSLVADAFDPASPDTVSLTTIDGSSVPGCAPYTEQNPVEPEAAVIELGGAGSSLSGFRIVGGGDSGLLALGSVTVTHNLIEGNERVTGAGMEVLTNNCEYGDTTTTIANNVIRANHAGAVGGGIWVRAGRDRFAHPPGTSCPGEGDAFLSIVDNLVEQNTALARGGGVEVLTYTVAGFSADVVITRNTIVGNRAAPYPWDNYDAWAAGLYAVTYGGGEETIRVFENTFEDNYAFSAGGGLSAFVGTIRNNDAVRHRIVIEDNVIRRNTAGFGGGGMELWVGGEDMAPPSSLSLLARNNLVEDNVVTGEVDFAYAQDGGGGVSASMYSERSSSASFSLQITGNLIRDNVSYQGGGLSAEVFTVSGADALGAQRSADARMEITGNLIHSNASHFATRNARGGGAYLELASLNDAAEAGIAFWLNTVADNALDNDAEGGGVHINSGTPVPYPGFTGGRAHVDLSSNIVAGNQGLGIDVTPPVGVSGSTKDYGTDLTVDVAFSDVVNNGAGNYGEWLGDLTGLGGNVSVDPRFVDHLAGDYHLTAVSALVDAGDPAVRPSTPDTDRDGDPRVVDGNGDGSAIVDTGYDEWVPRPIQVVVDIKPEDDGNSVNPRSRGVIPVAVLGREGFDVTTIDTSTVRFGPTAAPTAHPRGEHLEDVDQDGFLDLVLHFRTLETGIACGEVSAKLVGHTLDGASLQGTDGITTVGCSSRGRGQPAIDDESNAPRRGARGPVVPGQ